MGASLRFGLGFFAASFLGGAVALAVVGWQRDARLRVMAEGSTSGRVDAGEAAMMRYGCGACHEIPGIPDAGGRVGPSLDGFAARAEIAGLLANRPKALIRWLREPQTISPGNGMPNLGIGEKEARDIAAKLYTLD